jgi:hypothetical protein
MNAEITKNRFSISRLAAGLLAILFGVVTLVEGGATLNLDSSARPEGVIIWVLVFNFSAGFFYITAGMGTLLDHRWSLNLARVLAISSALVFTALGIHIAMGGDFMPRTVGAMTLRTGFWLGQSWFLARYFKRTHEDVVDLST